MKPVIIKKIEAAKIYDVDAKTSAQVLPYLCTLGSSSLIQQPPQKDVDQDNDLSTPNRY